MHHFTAALLEHLDLNCFWDFQEKSGEDRVARGKYDYFLKEMAGPIERIKGGLFGEYAAHIQLGQWLNLPRIQCPALNFHGQGAEFTMIAWVKREDIAFTGCQAVAGMWNESEKKRQYCMFIDLRIWESEDQLCGHVSSSGGPTPGYKYCMTSAIGATKVEKAHWHALAFSYDGTYAKVYIDGVLDERESFNPYYYDAGLYDGGEGGADFTVAAVHRSGEMGNFFAGAMGGLAVYGKALSDTEIHRISTLPL